jgi:D-Tyr-tRNAtyr deacylase
MNREGGFPCEAGVFQAHMEVTCTNDGPVTIILNSADL